MEQNINKKPEQQKKKNNEPAYETKPLNLNLLSSEDLHGPNDFLQNNSDNVRNNN